MEPKKNNFRHQKKIIGTKFSMVVNGFSASWNAETDPDADADYKRFRNHYSAMIIVCNVQITL